MQEYIYEKDCSLDNEFCEKIIDLFENSSKLQFPKKEIINTYYNKSITMSIKFDSSEWSDINSFFIKEIKQNIINYFSCIEYNKMSIDEILNKISINSFVINKYIKNEGYFIYHSEMSYNNYNNKYLLFNFIWYLNDVEEGGETEFFGGDYKINPKKGKFVIFPCEWFFPNTEKKPFSNDKYIITGLIFIDI